MKKLLKAALLSVLGFTLLGTGPNLNKTQNELNFGYSETRRGRIVIPPGAGFQSEPEPTNNEPLSVNTPKDFTFTANKVYKFQFTALSKGTYVIDATSTAMTRLYVDSPYTGQIFDSGRQHNAQIRVELEQYNAITIYATIDGGTTALAKVKMSVKKPKVSVASINFLNRNTPGGSLVSPEDDTRNTEIWFNRALNGGLDKSIGSHYSVEVHGGITESGIYEGFYQRDVIVYSGYAATNNGQTVLELENNQCILDNLSFTGTSLALWGACDTAVDSEFHNDCIAKNSVINGAKCSIGFLQKNEIPQDMMRYFICRFLNALTTPGTTVLEALCSCEQFGDLDLKHLPSNIDPNISDCGPNDPTIDRINSSVKLWNENVEIRVYGDSSLTFVGNSTSYGGFSLLDGSDLCTEPRDDEIPFGYTPISLGTTTLDASLGRVYKYSFTVPDKGYYVVDALSDDQTFLCVENSSGTCIYDGGNENNHNAKVRFLALKHETCTLYVARDGSLTIGRHVDINLTIRACKSTAIIVDSVDFINANIDYYNNQVYNNIQGYYQHTTYNVTHKNEITEKLNSEMFYITSLPEVLCLNSLSCLGHQSSDGAFTCADIGDMSNTRLALWGINYSGVPGGFAQTSVQHGAKCSIGFYGTWQSNNNYDCLELTEIGEFCRLLISYLCTNRDKTIQEGLNYIRNNYPCFNHLSSYIRVFGNSYTKLFQDTISNHPFDLTETFLTKLPEDNEVGVGHK